MVEAAGVEPASESSLTGISPSAVRSLHSLTVTGMDTLYGSVASSCMVRAKLTARTCTAHRRSSPARGPSGGNGRLIRQPRQLYCCQLSLKIARFIEARRLCSLFQPHHPRRNRYAPIWCLPRFTRGRGDLPLLWQDTILYRISGRCQPETMPIFRSGRRGLSASRGACRSCPGYPR